MANRRPGRPLKLTPALLNKLCVSLRQGMPKRAAAALIGVHRDSLNTWEIRGRLARSKRDEGLPLDQVEEFLLHAVEEIELAVDFGEGWLFDLALKATRREITGVRATDVVMLLERTRPDQWRRPSSMEYIERSKQAPTRRIDVSKLDKDERQALRDLLAKARDEDA